AKARASLTVAGSAACLWRYWAWVRRSLPVRLAGLSGALRQTTTETVILVLGGAGVSPAPWTKGAFSLPGRTARGEAVRLEVRFFFVLIFFVLMRSVSKFWG